jgi:serine/threonine protein kinase
VINAPLDDQGQQSDVYLAKRRGEQYVVKLYHIGWRLPDRLQSFLTRVSHPNVARILDCGDWGGQYYEVYDYYPEGSLEDSGSLSSQAIQEVLVPSVNEGLHELHKNGIIHRDIKPANLYMPPGHPEKACVMDLGVVKTEETQTNGSLPGTLDYMPPEMATGTSRGEPAVDIYALGLCLYEALTCKTAYPRLKRGGDGLAEFYKRAKAGDKPDLSGLAGSPMWRKLVTKMTDPDVGRRIKTAREVVRLITRIPDSELPDVREKSADAADQESTDNYVLPGTRGGALPAGETGESADSDSTEVHVDNALSESPGGEDAASGERGEQASGTDVAPAPPPARTNSAAEEKLSAAIAEVETSSPRRRRRRPP